MWMSILGTFGPFAQVSCGKLRTTGIVGFYGFFVLSGVCGLDRLYAQGPEIMTPGSEQSDGERRGRRGRGGFDPAQMLGRLDQNGDGVITANEVESAPGFARRMLQDQGLDFGRGVRVDELQQMAQQRMEERRRQREAERGESSERPDRPDWSPPQSMGRGDAQGAAAAPTGGAAVPSTTASSSSSQLPRTRVSPFLPDAFQSYDTNLDGQIALSEWRKGKRGPISQFMQYDLDGDGFLIARELLKANAVVPAQATPTAAGSPVTTTATSPVTTAPPATGVPAPAVPMAPVVVSAEDALKATRAFELLDKDKSGTVVANEWTESRRLKPLFEKGGYDLAKPLNREEFIQGFVRVGAGK